MNQQCYTGTHLTFWMPLGVVACLVFCLGIPAMSFTVMAANRHKLDDLKTRRVLGFMFVRYR